MVGFMAGKQKTLLHHRVCRGEEGLSAKQYDLSAWRFQRLRAGRGGRRLGLSFAVEGVVHLLTMDWNFFGCTDAQPHLVTPNFHHRDGDIIVDNYTLLLFPGQYKQRG